MGHPRWQAPDLKQVESLAKRGLSMEQIAISLGVHVATLYRHQKAYAEFRSALERGRAAGIMIVANELFEAAVKGDRTAQIFFLKAHAGWRDQGDPTININLGSGIGGQTDLEREEQIEAIRMLTFEERQQYLELMRRARQRLRKRKLLRGGAAGAVEALPSLPAPGDGDGQEIEDAELIEE